jgi:hypothetical protein
MFAGLQEQRTFIAAMKLFQKNGVSVATLSTSSFKLSVEPFNCKQNAPLFILASFNHQKFEYFLRQVRLFLKYLA